MTKKTKNYDRIKELINGFLNESLDIDEVLKLWPNQEKDMEKREGYLVHGLLHFKMERHIHEKDKKYEQFEREAIKDLFDRLV